VSINVKLSDYERALNQLNNIPAKQARIFEAALASLKHQRDEARAEVDTLRSQVERLRGVLHIVSLDEYESTTSASEKVHAHARQARIVLNETLAEVTPSDAAHIASLENLFIKACRRAENLTIALADMRAQRDEARAGVERLRAEAAPMNEYFTAGYRDGSRDAFRRGAEAMREACAKWVADYCSDGRAGVVRALPIPEDKP
jgi:chemotaxis protein histidine kinase CheA